MAARGVPAGANRPNHGPPSTPRHAGLRHGRHVGRSRAQRLCRGHCQRAHLAARELLLGQRHDVEHHVDVAGHQILQRRRGAAIVHDARCRGRASCLNCSPARWPELPMPGDAGGELAGIGLDVGDQLLRRLRRHRRMHDQHVRTTSRCSTIGDEILGRIDRAASRSGAAGSHWCRGSPCRTCSRRAATLRGGVGADRAAGAGAGSPPRRCCPPSPSLAAQTRAPRCRRRRRARSDTMILIGCDGYCCALAGRATNPIASIASKRGDNGNDIFH